MVGGGGGGHSASGSTGVRPSGTVTFLLSDVEGSTRLWEQEREAMDAALRRHDEIIEAAVAGEHGTLLKSRGEGDSTFSVFTRASEAANAAVRARASLRGEEWPTSHAITVRMAIHTGEAVERDGDYFGPAVNRVARLRGVAQAGEILVSQSAAQVLFDVVGKQWSLIDVGERALKDIPRAERVYALVDEVTSMLDETTTPLPPASHQGAIHGRTRELGDVAAVLREVADGRLHVIEVEGEPGIGKSRLLAEAAMMAHAAGFFVFAGGCEQWEIGRPYAPLITAVDNSGLGSSRRWAELRALLTGSQAQPVEGTTDAVSYRVAEVLADSLEALTVSAPVAIVVDDLQWADSGTMMALHAVTRRLDALPVAMLLGRRPLLDRSAGAAAVTPLDHARTTRLLLGPLDDDALRAVVRDVAGGEPGDRLLRQARATGGHPLFVLELLSVLDSEGALRQLDGRVEVDSISPPPSLHLTLLRHLSFLGSAAFELLRLASVLGPSFDVRELAAVTGRPAADLVTALDELLRSGLLRDDGNRLRFHHDLVREAVYTDIASAVRVALHADAWRALAAADMPSLTIARHVSIAARRGDAEAVDWLRRAAREVVSRDPASTAELLRQAADLTLDDAVREGILTELAEVLAFAGDLIDAESLARSLLDAGAGGGGRVHLALVQALFARGRWTEVVAAVDRAREDRAIDDGLRGRLLAESALARIWTGDAAGARRDAEEAVELGRASGDNAALSFGYGHLSVLAAQAARFEEAIELAERGVAEAAGLRDAHRRHPHIALGMALFGAGRLEEAKASLEEGRSLGERTGTRWDQPLYHAMLALPKLSLGEWDDAVADAESSLALADELGSGAGRVTAWSVISLVAAHRGDASRAAEGVAAANRVVNEMGPQWGMLWFGQAAVLVRELSGDHKSAADLLDFIWGESVASGVVEGQLAIAADLARSLVTRDDRKRLAEVAEEMTRVLGHTAAPLPRAVALTVEGLAMQDEARLREATDTLRSAGHLPEVAAVLVDTAELLAAKGRPRPAQESLDAALEMYERLGARHDASAVAARLRRAGLRPPKRTAPARATFGWEALTKTELSVVRLAAQGLTNPEIGERLFISRRTVQTHLSHVFTKLGMSSRVELAAAAAQRQL